MFLLAMLLLVQAAGVHESLSSDPICSTAGTSYGIAQCIQKQALVWNGRMNKEYRKALKRVSPQARPWLRRAQKLWVQYRKANCKMHSRDEGSAAQLSSSGCILGMAKQRALELHDIN
jgi:uncharacterized protein YecT (DUF1311 family)